MPDKSFLQWPFFETRHRRLAEELEGWAADHLDSDPHLRSRGAVDDACVELVHSLGRDGWLSHSGTDPDSSDPEAQRLDVRSLCLIRETLARHDDLADFSFAMQGLGSGALSLFGTPVQRRWLVRTRSGDAIPAFALTEEQSGSDVANMQTSAKVDGAGFVLNGGKTWVSNGGIADFYTLFARTGEAPGAKGLSAFLVPADTPGLEIAERLEVASPHPLARLELVDVRVDGDALIGQAGEGFKIAMQVLDVFRPTVGAAALGMARRALDLTVERVGARELFGGPMSQLQLVRGHVADMAVEIDSMALLVYRAAWAHDKGDPVTREASMAKLYATESAQRVVDQAVQLHGGDGVRFGHPVESLYRSIRALRIYEGASDIQKLIIARQVLSPREDRQSPA